ncbi:hypothetical protein WJX81_003686 [Elliptochloris bilobata]|uniref:Uncharacterized protein n=1 Tax=Elliptochloris bilobata TaxID=381761 RepID=A0AAW1S595_9CHLO
MAAAGMICVILTAFFCVIARLQPLLERRPHAFVILPVLGVACMLSILPLAFFLGSQSQFGRLNPINPRDYFLLARKALRALRENNLKVTSKDF